MSPLGFLYAYVFNLYCPWVAWSSRLNLWSSSYSIDPQGDPRASKLEGSYFWPITSKVEVSNSFNCLHREGSNNYLQLKGPTSYCLTTFTRRDPITASKWMDLILSVHILHASYAHILMYEYTRETYAHVSYLTFKHFFMYDFYVHNT